MIKEFKGHNSTVIVDKKDGTVTIIHNFTRHGIKIPLHDYHDMFSAIERGYEWWSGREPKVVVDGEFEEIKKKDIVIKK